MLFQMKTRINLTFMLTGFICLVIITINGFGNELKQLSKPEHHFSPQQDTLYQEISGIVLDKITRKAVSYANILVFGTHIGTVSNSDGVFIIKIPYAYRKAKLQISNIAYQTLTVLVSNLQKNDNIFLLEPEVYSLEEVEIKMSNPLKILRDVMKNVSSNYGNEPALLTVFYRETVQNNDNFVSVSEAVFDVYKSGYGKIFDSDRIKISKARKSRHISPKDRVLFKLQGGPYNIFRLDIVKYPGEILSPGIFDSYDYSVKGMIPVNERNAYVISFEQKPHSDLSLYKGNIFIDAQSKAIAAMEFSLTEEGAGKAADFLIVKQPSNIQVEVISADYKVNYKFYEDKWILNHARAELEYKCNWNKKFLQSNYSVPEPEVFKVIFEMAVTNIHTENIRKFKIREVVKPGEIFTEMVSGFEDPEFWGDYNIIVPEQSIEQAVERLGSRMKNHGFE